MLHRPRRAADRRARRRQPALPAARLHRAALGRRRRRDAAAGRRLRQLRPPGAAPRERAQHRGRPRAGPNFNEADVSRQAGGDPEHAADGQAAIANLTRRYRCRLESHPLGRRGRGATSSPRSARRACWTTRTSSSPPTTASSPASTGSTTARPGSTSRPSTVPLIVRGPGVAARASRVRDLTINADLAATVRGRERRTSDARDRRPVADSGREAPVGRARARAADRHRPVRGDPHPALRLGRVRDRRARAVRPADATRTSSRACTTIPPSRGSRPALASRLAALRTCAGSSCRSAPALRREAAQDDEARAAARGAGQGGPARRRRRRRGPDGVLQGPSCSIATAAARSSSATGRRELGRKGRALSGSAPSSSTAAGSAGRSKLKICR